MHRLFVYGTLKKGFSNYDRIFAGNDNKITPAWTYGKLYDLGWYPALTQGNNKVYGELIVFANHEILRKIDYLEGFRGENNLYNFYDRKEIQVFSDKEKVTAWTYFINISKLANVDVVTISSGVWAK